MTEAKDAGAITGYHAHVYYDEASRERASWLREQVALRFTVVLGRWREEPVGPHPLPMDQMAFARALFPDFVPWLQSVRGPLSILVHMETGVSDLMDHSVGALWLGKSLALKFDFFDKEGKSA